MLSTISITVIPENVCDGTPRSFGRFKRGAIVYGMQTNEDCETGSLPWMLSAAEFAVIQNGRALFVEVNDPGSVPPPPVPIGGTASAYSQQKAETVAYDKQMIRFKNQEKGKKALRAYLKAHMDQPSRDYFANHEYGDLGFTIRELYVYVETNFGLYDPVAMTALRAEPIIPLGLDENPRIYNNRRALAYTELADHGEIVPVAQKIRELKAGTIAHAHLKEAWLFWEKKYLTVVDQNAHYDEIVEALKTAHDKYLIARKNGDAGDGSHGAAAMIADKICKTKGCSTKIEKVNPVTLVLHDFCRPCFKLQQKARAERKAAKATD